MENSKENQLSPEQEFYAIHDELKSLYVKLKSSHKYTFKLEARKIIEEKYGKDWKSVLTKKIREEFYSTNIRSKHYKNGETN